MSDPPTPDFQLTIRPAKVDDLESVAAIDLAAGLSGWSAASYRETGFTPAADFRVAEREGLLVAFCLAVAQCGEVEILRIAVIPAEQGKGIARRLLAGCLEEARLRGSARAFLEVRETNGPAVCLYLGFGFKLVGRRRKYYSRPVEDALVMELVLQ